MIHFKAISMNFVVTNVVFLGMWLYDVSCFKSIDIKWLLLD